MSEQKFHFFSNIKNMLKKPRKLRFGRYDVEKVPNSRENFFCYQIFRDYVLTYLWERDMSAEVAAPAAAEAGAPRS